MPNLNLYEILSCQPKIYNFTRLEKQELQNEISNVPNKKSKIWLLDKEVCTLTAQLITSDFTEFLILFEKRQPNSWVCDVF